MKSKTALHLAYYLVTTGFTLGLIGLIIMLLSLIMTGRIPVGEKEINIRHGNYTQLRTVVDDDKYVLYDTSFYYRDSAGSKNEFSVPDESYVRADWLNVKNSIRIPSEQLKQRHRIQDFYINIRFLLIYLGWLYIAYQIFLVLYDIKKENYFVSRNPSRFRKMGFVFFFISLMHLFTLEYSGMLYSDYELYIMSEFEINIFGRGFLSYLAIAALMLVLSLVFIHGKILKEETELTV